MLSASQLIVESISLCKNNWKKFLPYIFLVSAVTITLTILSQALALELSFIEVLSPMVEDGFTFSSEEWIKIAIGIGIGLLSTIINLWLAIALINVTGQLYTKQPITNIVDMLSGSIHRIFPAFIASILIGIMLTFGFVLFIIPAIIMGIWFTFTKQAIALEGMTAIAGIKRSKELVKGRWWSVLWKILLPSLLFTLILWSIQELLQTIFTIPLSYLNNTSAEIILMGVLFTIVTMIFVPLYTSVQTILYIDLMNNPVQKTVIKKEKKVAPKKKAVAKKKPAASKPKKVASTKK